MTSSARWRLWGLLAGLGLAMLVSAPIALAAVASDPSAEVTAGVLGFVVLFAVAGLVLVALAWRVRPLRGR